MHEAGSARSPPARPKRTGIYSFERKEVAKLSQEQAKTLRANRKAAAFFDAQPPGYRRDGDPLGRQREAAGDPRAPPLAAHRRQRYGEEDRAPETIEGAAASAQARKISRSRLTAICSRFPRPPTGGEG